MKPRRHLFRSRSPFSAPLRYGVPVILGFSVFITGAHAGDLLRGGGSAGAGSAPASGSTSGGTTSSTVETSRANARDALARTTQTLAAVQALQNAAINAAAQNAGTHPTTGQPLPNVPNGLGTGGLQTAPGVGTDPTQWTGAELPTQSIDGSHTNVTIRQTAQQALLNWQTFNIGKDTTLTFDQTAGGASATQWIAFNKISDPSANPTQILGQIKAVGQVYLINSNGIIFGGSSQINVHTLVASALPINDSLVANGLLNNPNQQFLFNGLGTTGKLGDVTIQAGARLTTPVSNDGNGGRVFLTGANVTNEGVITTPGGQTILAAGLQVGILAHSSDDPSIRGLDVYVGAVTDPASALTPYAGTATNKGLIESALGNITISGKSVSQSGVLESSTSVSLNGSIRLLANYDASRNAGYSATDPNTGTLFNYASTGDVTFGEGSLTRILPQYSSTEKTTGNSLALRSSIQVQGNHIRMEQDSEILAPNAQVSFQAGVWSYVNSLVHPNLVATGGDIFLDDGSVINLAGTVDATASVLQNYLTVTLNGSELSVAPLQRDGELRGDSIIVDITKTGTYNGEAWVGTPLADVSGYLNLIERDVSQLTTAGGTLSLSAGNSVTIKDGVTIDVSGGWTNFTGALVQTTQLWANGRLVDIADATPDQVYQGIFTGISTFSSQKWGTSDSYLQAIAPNGKRYQAGYIAGANAGSISITTPSFTLDGTLKGTTVAGDYQVRSSSTGSNLPKAGSFTLNLQKDIIVGSTLYAHAPNQTNVVFGSSDQTAADTLYLSAELLSTQGFGNLTVVNEGGNIILPESITLTPQNGSSISLTAANIDIQGNIISAGSNVSFTALNVTSFGKQLLVSDSPSPTPNVGRGVFTLGSSAVINVAGLLTDGRSTSSTVSPIALSGGSVTVAAYTADLQAGSVMDVSGGYVLTSTGQGNYGNGGSITIEAGNDPGLHTTLGGYLNLQGTLKGYSGAQGATLSLQAPRVQIGGTTSEAGTLLLQPEFFNQGGFASFKLTGLGIGSSTGVLVTAGTEVAPIVKSYEAVITPAGSGLLSLNVIEDIASKRTPVSLTLNSGITQDLSIYETGEVVVEEGAVIRTDAGGSVTLTGTTITVLGSIITPGGAISVGGGKTSGIDPTSLSPLITTFLGPHAVLSTAGTTVYEPDAYGRRKGKVWNGGTISLSGNLSLSTGALVDVSGTSAILDVAVDSATPAGSPLTSASGVTDPLAVINTVPVKVDSVGGSIILKGAEALFTDATLLANAGGNAAIGGSLAVSSGTYNPTAIPLPASTVNLTVTQSGGAYHSGIGSALGDGGHFAVTSFANGGFDSLALNGVVSFSGDVSVTARGNLSVASDGFLYADGNVNLQAAHATLGKSQPVAATTIAPFTALPSYGSGTIAVSAGLIDVGNLSLQQIGKASLTAVNGDIRGSGTFQIAGDLTLKAGQIYPNTASKLSFIAYDHVSGGITQQSHITAQSSGVRSLPLSAGGTLSLYASNITQEGTLRAPFGTINLGWDGTGTAPVDLLAGSSSSSVPITKNLTLAAGSVTSVSAIDPVTGKAWTIPYGISTDGENWIDPTGTNITTTGVPIKTINLAGVSVSTEEGSSIDLRGGGDLYAYRWIKGLGGPSDILNSTTSFAIIPSSASAPVSEYNTTDTSSSNLISGYNGYTNANLKVGDQIYLSGSATLPAGYYTLLPARYALLPEAVLVTPKSGSGSQAIEMPDSSSLVSGYRFNSLNPEVTPSTIASRFEVASSKVVRARAQYEDHLANLFFKNVATANGIEVPPLPVDSGHLVFQATQAMELLGEVASKSVANGRGAIIDISTSLNIIISSNGFASTPGTIHLDSDTLSSFGAESLLIGGKRTISAAGSTVSVTSGNLTVDNAGSTLSAQDLILGSKNNLTLQDGSSLASTGTLSVSDDLALTGNGTLVRVSADQNASILRSNTTSSSALLEVGENVNITGAGIILDSSSQVSLAGTADLIARSYTFDAANIALLLDHPGTVASGSGLVISNEILQELQAASSLKLMSYSSIDIYGTGTFGSTSPLSSLTLSAGQIRGVNTGGGTASVSAKTVRLENHSNVASTIGTGSTNGSLNLIADTIELGRNTIAANGFSSVVLDASRGVIGQGTGGLIVQKDLTIQAPVIAGAAGAMRTITAGGAVSLANSARAGSNTLASGLGSALTLTGASVHVDTVISLPSGSLTLKTTSGDLTVHDLLDVSGASQRFHDVTKITSAGNITLAAAGGNVILGSGSTLNLSSPASGGNGGNLSVSTPAGSFTSTGATILGSGGSGGTNGSFVLDVLSLSSLSALNSTLAAAQLNESQSIRARTGNVVVDGAAFARNFELSADQGNIAVTGTVDASGATGGSIHLSAHGDLTLASGAKLTVAAQDFSSAGKGGSIALEAGTQLNGVAGTGWVDIQTGSVIDLSVTSKIAGLAGTVGTSAYNGEFSGKLHLRAARNSTNNDLNVRAINGTIIDASSILVEGYKLYSVTGSTGTITNQATIRTDSENFLGAYSTSKALSEYGNYNNITARLLANNSGLESGLVLATGVEIVNPNGDLTLGSANSTISSDWNLSNYRFGAKGSAGVLTLRASGDIVFYNSISDGFTPLTSDTNNPLWTARLMTQNALLPVNEQSWSYRFTAGADLTASDFSSVLSKDVLAADKGSLKLGKASTNVTTATSLSATTASVIASSYQVIRTGSGDIDINAGRDVQIRNQLSSIYTAGSRVADYVMGGLFKLPSLTTVSGGNLGSAQQSYAVQYTMAGGDVNIHAGEDIEHVTWSSTANAFVADSQFQMPTNWLYRRGYVDSTGAFGMDRNNTSASTSWWVDFSNFFQGVGALGGGGITMVAGNNISNVDAVIPTNARMTGYTSSAQTQNARPDANNLLELGGGDLVVRAGNNIDAGVYYIERGHATLAAGGSILTNATRSAVSKSDPASVYTQLPTTLFLGKGGYDISANGDILLGPVANPFLLPGGFLNSFYHKSYFSTYSQDSYVTVESLGGDVTLRTSAASTGGATNPLLELWYTNKLLLTVSSSNPSASANKPWLRLNESGVSPFNTLFSLLPGTITATAFSGDINLAGNLLLSPSSTGNVAMYAGGAINALQPNGVKNGYTSWGNSQIIVSDANPDAIPGITTPFGYQGIGGTTVGAATTSLNGFLFFVDNLFAESGATLGSNVSLQTQQKLHDSGILHRDDEEPVRLYANEGDISGLTLFSPKEARVIAGRDISDISFYIQNVHASDTSIVAAGRDILPYTTSSELSQLIVRNQELVQGHPQAGDIQINGPGSLQVLAGRDLDLGTGSNNADGTGTGITSIGNTRNPYLSNAGADLIVGAGIGLSSSLSGSDLHVADFIQKYVLTDSGAKYLEEIQPGVVFADLTEDRKSALAIEVFYRVLRDAGRDYSATGSYETGLDAIKTLFGDEETATWNGDILARSRDIRTSNGGDISLFTPGGGITLASSTTGSTLAPPGIITAAGGNISIFAHDDINIGIGRIFTLRGGNEIIWSTQGDIAAGSSSKTVQTASPTRVRIDPITATVQTDLSGLATGGGIGVLTSVKGVKPGNVDLIAPEGSVDAGDAGIRVSGNLNISAVQVINAGNISVGGNSAGVPASVSAGANVATLTSASTSAAATTAAETSTLPTATTTAAQVDEALSIITVEVIGYGGSSDDEDEKEKNTL